MGSGVKLKKSNGITKFKVRCSRFLYTFRVADPTKAEKIQHSLPPGTPPTAPLRPNHQRGAVVRARKAETLWVPVEAAERDSCPPGMKITNLDAKKEAPSKKKK